MFSGYTPVRSEEGRIGQIEKLIHTAVITEPSTDPIG